MGLLVSAHQLSSEVSGTHHHAQDFDHIRHCGRYYQINLLSQEGRWLARTTCVKHCFIYSDCRCLYLYCKAR